MNESVIVSTARTQIGKAYKGAFNNTHMEQPWQDMLSKKL